MARIAVGGPAYFAGLTGMGSSSYLTGAQDPYAQLRKSIQGEIGASPLDPQANPTYQNYLPQMQEQIASDFASRGLGDSGLAIDAAMRAQNNLYADLWNQARQQRAGLYGILSGIPYLQNQQYAGGGGGAGTVLHDTRGPGMAPMTPTQGLQQPLQSPAYTPQQAAPLYGPTRTTDPVTGVEMIMGSSNRNYY